MRNSGQARTLLEFSESFQSQIRMSASLLHLPRLVRRYRFGEYIAIQGEQTSAKQGKHL